MEKLGNIETVERANRISCVEQADGSIDIVVSASMAEAFRTMVKKGTNLSPDMHVEIRDFTDRILKRDSYVGACMKQELYGYPSLRTAIIMPSDPIAGKLDIPAEDAYDIATDPNFVPKE
jgi:hypothetical protein